MNLFIVEDSPYIQNRLIRFVEGLPDVHVVGVAGDINSAYSAILNTNTDALILDVQLSDGNGLHLLKNIKQSNPEIKVVVLTNHSTEANRLHALRAGADGFLDKSTDFEQIPRILHDWQQSTQPKNLN
ncbi:MAG: response regulator transcription factor [Undibacterium sp.]|jgi:DNA-binding NarL/FixJ family response regulator|uniref:response regulator n=1 Tax=Undibacterium sp. TaxID=1914977 RepID=UPI00272895B0|nr:response regulator transcription factor [Undibacterium sp.]MDO8653852.1 response regulator transcription factor [Undibacterium sp.]